MRLLIAGWHGQVARALIEAAPARPEIKALAVGRPALDVRDPRSIERAFGDIEPSIVINTAAYTAVDQAETDREAAFALNRDGARRFAQAAARRGIPIIQLSTYYVFDGTKPFPYDEQDQPGPKSVYGASKLEGEQAVREANPRHVIIRTGWVVGTGKQSFAEKILAAAASGEPLRVVADQTGNPTYAPHLATAVLDVAREIAAGRVSDAAWGTYHAAGAGVASWHDLACEILRLAGDGAGQAAASVVPIAMADYPTVAPRPSNAALDCRKFEAAFGLRLPSWQDGAAACMNAIVERRTS